MSKTYVLDTNVLIQAPYAMQCFEDNHVVIPLVVVEELDGLKKADGERGFNARQAIRFLERLRLRGNLLDGVPLDNGGTLRIEINCVHEALPDSLPDDQADNRILKVCRHLQQCQPILVTKDLVLRLKAQVLNIEAQDFSREQVLPEKNAYTGRLTCYVPEASFDDFLTQGVAVSQLYLTDRDGRSYAPEVQENEFVILQADASLRKTHLGRVHQGRVLPLTYSRVTPYGIKPRNAGQYFMQEALMQPASEAPLVIIKGQAGTAKTFYSLAVGLEKIVNHPTGEYRRILICRPNAQFDSDIGLRTGKDFAPHAAHHRQPGTAHRQQRRRTLRQRTGTGRKNRGNLRPPAHPDRSPQFHPRPLPGKDIPHHRRSPEHDAEPGQRHHHPGRERYEDHPRRRPQPNRQTLPG